MENNEIVEDVKDLSPEERAAAWEKWIRAEVNSVLDIYLPFAKAGFVKVEYSPYVKEVREDGPELDPTKAEAVLIKLAFEFNKPIDLTKPRPETV